AQTDPAAEESCSSGGVHCAWGIMRASAGRSQGPAPPKQVGRLSNFGPDVLRLGSGVLGVADYAPEPQLGSLTRTADAEQSMAVRAGKEAIYEAANAFRRRCLGEGRSLLWPQSRAWTPQALTVLWDAFIGRSDLGERTFFEKWHDQLSGLPPDAQKVA